MYHLTTEQYRRKLRADGYAVDLPPWPEHIKAYAAMRQKLSSTVDRKDCPGCRLKTEDVK